jgi:hypothetical protein
MAWLSASASIFARTRRNVRPLGARTRAGQRAGPPAQQEQGLLPAVARPPAIAVGESCPEMSQAGTVIREDRLVSGTVLSGERLRLVPLIFRSRARSSKSPAIPP